MSSRYLQDMPSRHLWGMSSRRLQDMSSRHYVFSVTIFRPPRRLQDVFAKRLQHVLEEVKTCWRRVEDVLKTCLEDVLKTSSRPKNSCLDNSSFLFFSFFFDWLSLGTTWRLASGVVKEVSCVPVACLISRDAKVHWFKFGWLSRHYKAFISQTAILPVGLTSRGKYHWGENYAAQTRIKELILLSQKSLSWKIQDLYVNYLF